MALYSVATGATIEALDVTQFYNLLTGVMTDQAVTLAKGLNITGGNVGIGTTSPNYFGYAGQVATIEGTAGTLELVGTAADGSGVPIAAMAAEATMNAGHETRLGSINVNSAGTSTGNRGGLMQIYTKIDGGALALALGLDQTQLATFYNGLKFNDATAAKFVKVATGVYQILAADGATVLWTLTDAGLATLRNALSIPPSAGGTVAASSYGSVPVKIAEVSLSASAASISFSSIPQGFRHLELVTKLRDDSAGTSGSFAVLRVNADSGANYYAEDLVGYGTTVAASETVAATSAHGIIEAGGGQAANLFAYTETRLIDYASAAIKALRHETAQPNALSTGQLNIRMTAGFWNSTAAINALSIAPGTGSNFVAGSLATLWGQP